MSKIKSAEEIIEKFPSTKLGLDDYYGSQTVSNIIKEAQRQAIEATLEVAAKNVNSYFDHTHVSNEFDLTPTIELIINLKKKHKDLKL